MSNVKQIAEVLREHQLGFSKSKGFHCLSIECGWHGHDLEFPEHQAEMILAALEDIREY